MVRNRAPLLLNRIIEASCLTIHCAWDDWGCQRKAVTLSTTAAGSLSSSTSRSGRFPVTTASLSSRTANSSTGTWRRNGNNNGRHCGPSCIRSSYRSLGKPGAAVTFGHHHVFGSGRVMKPPRLSARSPVLPPFSPSNLTSLLLFALPPPPPFHLRIGISRQQCPSPSLSPCGRPPP